MRPSPLAVAVLIALPVLARGEAVFTSLWRQIGARAGAADPALYGQPGPGLLSRSVERRWFDPAGAVNEGRARQTSFIDEGSIVAAGEQSGYAELLGGQPGFGAGADWIEADFIVTTPTVFDLRFTVSPVGGASPDALELILQGGPGTLLAYSTAAGELSGTHEGRLLLEPGAYEFRWMIQRGAVSTAPLGRSGTYELTVRIPGPGALGILALALLPRRR